jgi:ribose-phosphate pyrophosphokinase
VMNVIGDVKDRFCILIDDIADSAGTLCNAAAALKEQGASDVVAYITHGVLSGKAVERVEASVLRKLVITDSIVALDNVAAAKKIRHLPIAPLLGEAIKRIADESSVSSLFD